MELPLGNVRPVLECRRVRDIGRVPETSIDFA